MSSTNAVIRRTTVYPSPVIRAWHGPEGDRVRSSTGETGSLLLQVQTTAPRARSEFALDAHNVNGRERDLGYGEPFRFANASRTCLV